MHGGWRTTRKDTWAGGMASSDSAYLRDVPQLSDRHYVLTLEAYNRLLTREQEAEITREVWQIAKMIRVARETAYERVSVEQRRQMEEDE